MQYQLVAIYLGGWLAVLAPAAVSAHAASEKVLYAFKGSADGIYPGALIHYHKKFYGTTFLGGNRDKAGNYSNCGTVYSLDRRGAKTTFYAFKATNDGCAPSSALVPISETLYGVTFLGGAVAAGTVFAVNLTGSEKLVYSFNGTDGNLPFGKLLNQSGTLYGTTEEGEGRVGNVFSINTASGAEANVYTFNIESGAYPLAGLINLNGVFFGTTSESQTGSGIVYALTPAGAEETLHSFQ